MIPKEASAAFIYQTFGIEQNDSNKLAEQFQEKLESAFGKFDHETQLTP